MALNADELAEFEEEIKLQQAAKNDCVKSETKIKTRIDDDGTEMEWDEKKKAWFPKIDDNFIAKYQMQYGNFEGQQTQSTVDSWTIFAQETEKLRQEKGVDDPEVKERIEKYNNALTEYYNSPAYREWYENYQKQMEDQSKHRKPPVKRRKDDEGEDPDIALARAETEQNEGVPMPQIAEEPEQAAVEEKKPKQAGPAWYDLDESKNTHVYVSGLPTENFDEEAFVDLMSKCGLLAHDPLLNKPRVKLYRDSDGKLKGDGRCCYIKVESVDLALQILDGTRLDETHEISVQRAKFQPKGEFDPKKRRRLTNKEKKRIKETQENLLKWGMETSRFVRAKKERTIVLRNVFHEADFMADVTLIPTVRERIRLQCAKCGTIKKLVVYDANKEGVVTVTYTSPEEADAAIGFLDNALFDYNTSVGDHRAMQLRVSRWDGKQRFDVQETDEERKARLDKWNEFLGGNEDETEEAADAEAGEKTPSDVGSAVETDEES